MITHTGKNLSLLLLITSMLTSCIEYEEETFDVTHFNVYNYYRTAPEFVYPEPESVDTASGISHFTLIPGTVWTYYHFSDSTDMNEPETVTLLMNSDTTARFSHEGTIYKVIHDNYSYSAVLIDSLWNSDTVVSILPIPHRSQLEQKFLLLPITMDDGSVSFSIKSTVYSSKYGRIEQNNGCLTKWNNEGAEHIAKSLNEFLVKEEKWFR